MPSNSLKKKKEKCIGSGKTWHKSVLRYRNTHDHGEKWAWLGLSFFVRWPFVTHRARKTSSHAHPVYSLPGCGINCTHTHGHTHVYITRYYRFASWNDKLNATIDSSLAFENLGATFSNFQQLSATRANPFLNRGGCTMGMHVRKGVYNSCSTNANKPPSVVFCRYISRLTSLRAISYFHECTIERMQAERKFVSTTGLTLYNFIIISARSLMLLHP